MRVKIGAVDLYLCTDFTAALTVSQLDLRLRFFLMVLSLKHGLELMSQRGKGVCEEVDSLLTMPETFRWM